MATINLADVANPNIKQMAADLMEKYNANKANKPIIAGREQMDQQIQNLLHSISQTGLDSGAKEFLQTGLGQTQAGMQTAGQTAQQALQTTQAGQKQVQAGFDTAEQAAKAAGSVGQPAMHQGQQIISKAVGALQNNPYIAQSAKNIQQAGAQLGAIGQGAGAQHMGEIISGANQLAQSIPVQSQIAALQKQEKADIENLDKQVNRNLQENVLPSLYRSQVASGNLGSSRAALSEGVAQRGASEALAKGVTNIENTAALKEAELRNQAFMTGIQQQDVLSGRNIATQLAGLQGQLGAGSQLLGAAGQQGKQAEALGGLGQAQASLGAQQQQMATQQAQLAANIAGGRQTALSSNVGSQVNVAQLQGDLAKLNAGTTEMGATQLQNLSSNDLITRLQAAKAGQDEKQSQRIYEAIKKKAEQDQGLQNILPYLQPMMAVGGQGYIQPGSGDSTSPLEAMLYGAGASVLGAAGGKIGESLGNSFSNWWNS